MAKVTVTSVPGSRFKQHLRAGGHQWLADEPKSLGGDDAGPDPYALLLGALGACTSMTIRLYAEKRGWNVSHVEVELEHHRMHAKDCSECEREGAFVDHISRKIRLEGRITPAQREKLFEIATRCPVHKALSAGMKISDHAPVQRHTEDAAHPH